MAEKKTFTVEITKGWTMWDGSRVRKGRRFIATGTSLDNATFWLRSSGHVYVKPDRVKIIGTDPFAVSSSGGEYKYTAKQNIYSPYSGDLLFEKGKTYAQVGGKPGRLTLATRPGCSVSKYSIDSEDIPLKHLFTVVKECVVCRSYLCIKARNGFRVGRIYKPSYKNSGYGKNWLGILNDDGKHRHFDKEWTEFFAPILEDV